MSWVCIVWADAPVRHTGKVCQLDMVNVWEKVLFDKVTGRQGSLQPNNYSAKLLFGNVSIWHGNLFSRKWSPLQGDCPFRWSYHQILYFIELKLKCFEKSNLHWCEGPYALFAVWYYNFVVGKTLHLLCNL